jgi:hypothetical protein
MGQTRLLKLFLVASICAALAVGQCLATATDSLERDGDVIILTGTAGIVELFYCLCCFVFSLQVLCFGCWQQPCRVGSLPELDVLSAVLACVADDNFDWATATGTWMVDIFAPWSVTKQHTVFLQQHRGAAPGMPAHISLTLAGPAIQLQIALSPVFSRHTLTATPA